MAKTKKEIVIHANKDEAHIAILEDGELAELHVENSENTRTIGDIQLAKVRNLMPSIQAAFVDIGMKQDAFLHFSDVSETLPQTLEMLGEKVKAADFAVTLRSRRRASAGGENDVETSSKTDGDNGKGDGKNNGKKEAEEDIHPARYLRNDQRILVQVTKEPMASKGSRVTTNLALAGRFLVLVPFGDYVAVSRKIYSMRERRRLRTLARSLVPEEFGLIVRTVAQNRDAKTLDRDLQLLLKKWEKINGKLEKKPRPPALLHQDVSMASSVIRDLFTDDYERILIDDPKLYRSIQNYIQAVAPDMAPAVQLYEGKKPIFSAVKAAKSIAEAFSQRVNMPSGGYLFIEHTEAMHVVDVNSGRAGQGQGKTQEENSLRVNLEAARILSKQLRLRDLGGIIVVDFIDQREDKNRKKVVDELKKQFRQDRAVTKVLPMSDFGLVQITRQRLRPSITRDQNLADDVLQGVNVDDLRSRDVANAVAKQVREQEAAASRPPVPKPGEFMTAIETWLANYRKKTKAKSVIMKVHPFAAPILRRGFPSALTRWRVKHRVRVFLETDQQVPAGTFVCVDPGTKKDVTDFMKPAPAPKPKKPAPA
ncbi:MAG: Rne/Rng family ribonuclease, partial [Bacteroidota bacterium]